MTGFSEYAVIRAKVELIMAAIFSEAAFDSDGLFNQGILLGSLTAQAERLRAEGMYITRYHVSLAPDGNHVVKCQVVQRVVQEYI